MFRRIIAVGLGCSVIICLCFSSTMAETSKKAKFGAKVRDAIVKIGTGPETSVSVKLRNKTKIKGFISEINDEGFVVKDNKTNVSTNVSYSQVKQVKAKNNLTGEQIALAVVVIAILIILATTL